MDKRGGEAQVTVGLLVGVRLNHPVCGDFYGSLGTQGGVVAWACWGRRLLAVGLLDTLAATLRALECGVMYVTGVGTLRAVWHVQLHGRQRRRWEWCAGSAAWHPADSAARTRERERENNI